MRVKIVDYETFRRECSILTDMHFLEVLAPRGYHFRMPDELFISLGDNLRVIMVTTDEMLPIGYTLTIVNEDIFDDSALCAQTVAFYLSAEHRVGLAGVKLLQCCEADLNRHCPGARWRLAVPLDGAKDLGRVIERFLGMAPIERLYQKVLAGENGDG